MEFKGTKGKWEWQSVQAYNWHKVLVKEPYKSICAININIEEYKANALLISKAPEMLLMLERVLTAKFSTEEIKQLIQEATSI